MNRNQTGDSIRNFHLSVAGYTGDGEYFTLMHFKRNIMHNFHFIFAANGKMFDIEYDLTSVSGRFIDFK
jgi:hypothetical protein